MTQTISSQSSQKTTGSGSTLPTSGWPSPTDFSDAIQNPRSAFIDPTLQECTVERRPTGVPWARTGAFASVFKLNYPNGDAVALRVFTPIPLQPEKEERLVAVCSHLESLGAQKPNFLVGYGYQAQGIRVKKQLFPIQTMDWVKGKTLGSWYQERMRAKDLPAIKAMAGHWQKLVVGLRKHQIAHGDLQHGNVMVRDDHTPVLVDYDGMCVPRLISDPPKPCFEFGLKGYVHPLRDTESLSLNLDHFPAWIILIALRASAADPTLFQRFVEEPEIENMLFSASDIANAASSKLWPELFKSPDAEVKTWAKELHASLDRPFSLVPPFQTDAFASLVEVCAAPTMDWEAIHIESERIAAGGKPLPQSLHPSIRTKVDTAKKKMASRALLRTALETARNTGDPRGVAATFDPTIYTDWPKHEGFVKQVNRAITRGKLLTELEAAAKSSPDGRKLLAVWDRAKEELADVPLAQNLGNQAEAWRAKIAAADGFIAAASIPNQTESVLAAAWARVVAAGPAHASLTAVHKDRGAKAAPRASVLDELRKVPTEPTEQADHRLIKLWDEPLLSGCAEASGYPPRVTGAKTRLAVLVKVADVVRRAESGSGAEATIVAAASALPANYVYDHRPRVVRAREGEEQFTGLKNLLNDPKSPESAIALEWMKFQKHHPKHVPLLEPARRDRCEVAVKRSKIIKEIERSVKESKDPFIQDKGIVAAWKVGKAIMDGSADMERLGPRIKLALVRVQAWERLDLAVRTQDVAAIRAAYSPPALSTFAAYPPVVAVRPQVEELIRLANWLDSLRKKLESAGQSTGLPLTAEDLENLRRHGSKLETKTRDAVTALLRKRLWPAIKLTPSSSPPQITPGPLPMAKVKWTWNGPDLVSWFEVATASGPLTDPAKAARDRISKCRPADHARDGGGKLIVLGPGPNVTVTIWPALDLGWETIVGPPIHVGPIRVGR